MFDEESLQIMPTITTDVDKEGRASFGTLKQALAEGIVLLPARVALRKHRHHAAEPLSNVRMPAEVIEHPALTLEIQRVLYRRICPIRGALKAVLTLESRRFDVRDAEVVLHELQRVLVMLVRQFQREGGGGPEVDVDFVHGAHGRHVAEGAPD